MTRNTGLMICVRFPSKVLYLHFVAIFHGSLLQLKNVNWPEEINNECLKKNQREKLERMLLSSFSREHLVLRLPLIKSPVKPIHMYSN